MDTLYIVILLYFAVGLFIGQAAVDYAKTKYRPWHYWLKFWPFMLISWPWFIYAIRNR